MGEAGYFLPLPSLLRASPGGGKGISHISQSYGTTEAGPERCTAVVIGQETPWSYFRRSHTYEALREGKFRHCLGISLSRFLVYGFLFVSFMATRKLQKSHQGRKSGGTWTPLPHEAQGAAACKPQEYDPPTDL